jgi:hypothetical protein
MVFNLNNIVYVSRRTVRSIARHQIDTMVEKMKQDPSSEWRKLGKAFAKFKPDISVEHKPSDWRLLQYALRLGWQFARSWMGGGNERDEKKGVKMSTVEANAISQSRSKLGSSQLQGFWLWKRRRTSRGEVEA